MAKKKKKLSYYFDKMSEFKLKQDAALQAALDIKKATSGKKKVSLTKEEKRKVLSNVRSGLTNKERKVFESEMKEKYEKYKKAYHKAKIEYRTRTAEKYTYAEFKEAYEAAYTLTDGRFTLSEFTDPTSYATLTEDAYEVKRQNLKMNQERYKNMKERGIPLTEAQETILAVDPDGNIHKIVAYFDKLGLNHEAFDSPGSAEN